MKSLISKLATFDSVIHSDTLERVPNTAAGHSECRRVLNRKGRCIFTIPTIAGRLSRSREGLENCYHGSADQLESGYVVQTEFGADMWKVVVEAGFSSVWIHCFEYPSALATEAMSTDGR